MNYAYAAVDVPYGLRRLATSLLNRRKLGYGDTDLFVLLAAVVSIYITFSSFTTFISFYIPYFLLSGVSSSLTSSLSPLYFLPLPFFTLSSLPTLLL
jgi:hypothetical protein